MYPVGDWLAQFIEFDTADDLCAAAACVAPGVSLRRKPIGFDQFQREWDRPLDPAEVQRHRYHVNQALARFTHLALCQSLHLRKRQLAGQVTDFAPPSE